jgi:hypothetical protein
MHPARPLICSTSPFEAFLFLRSKSASAAMAMPIPGTPEGKEF